MVSKAILYQYSDFMDWHGEQLTLDFGCTILVSQLFSWDHWSCCSHSNSNFKLKTSISGSRSFHLYGCVSTGHAHPSYSHTTLQMPLKHWVMFESKKLCPNLTPMCSLFAKVRAKKRVIGNKNHGANKHVIGNKHRANWKDSWWVLLRKVTQVYAQVGILCDPKWEGKGEELSPSECVFKRL
jgi:hypothetical protein